MGRDLSGRKNPFWGKQHTEGTRSLMRENHADVSGKKNPMFGKKRLDLAEYNRKRKGQPLLEKTKEKIGRANRGEKNPMFGKPCPTKGRRCSEQERQEMRKRTKEQWQDPEIRARMIEANKKRWRNPKLREKMLAALLKASHIKPNKAELKLFSILQKHFPDDYALNVKAEVMVLGGKIPDFVNVNGQKKVIELYGDYHHQNEKLENGGDGGRKREEIFAKCGFETLIVWEHELLNEDLLVQRLTRFKFVRRKHSHCQN